MRYRHAVRRLLSLFASAAAIAIAIAIALDGGVPSTTPPSTGDGTTSTTGTAPSGPQGTVEGIIDGDSVRLDLDGVTTEVRLMGINAPERDECWAEQSRDGLATLAMGREVTVITDSTDQYGRTLAYLYDGGTNLNLAQVAAGNALVIASDHDLLPEFLAAEEDALGLGLGMWAPDACGVALDHAVSIWGLEPDAPGRDDENPNGEFIAITNEGDPIDLGGWTVRDESSVHRFTFPRGFVLDPGGIVVIRSGCGTDDPPDLAYWCADTTVWTNSGDTALLLEPSGAIADRLRYFGD